MKELFRKFAAGIANIVGSAYAFIGALIIIVVWAFAGPVFNFSNTWQLAINSATTIVTFLVVFLIQNTQNRDSRAVHLKLDELLRGIKGARDSLIDVEELPDEVLEKLHLESRAQQERVSKEMERRGKKIISKKSRANK
jgi:low affinity Fe/Cu permease